MADEPRFDVPEILRATAFIVGIPAVVGLVVPVVGAVAMPSLNTLNISGHEIYNLGFWIIAWGITVWQGSQMLKRVHDRIIDDMLVTAIIAAVGLLIVKVVIWFLYEPTRYDATGEATILPLITAIDAGAALVLVVVALIGARANRY